MNAVWASMVASCWERWHWRDQRKVSGVGPGPRVEADLEWQESVWLTFTGSVSLLSFYSGLIPTHHAELFKHQLIKSVKYSLLSSPFAERKLRFRVPWVMWLTTGVARPVPQSQVCTAVLTHRGGPSHLAKPRVSVAGVCKELHRVLFTPTGFIFPLYHLSLTLSSRFICFLPVSFMRMWAPRRQALGPAFS